MTYCVGLLFGHGLVFASDIHANAEQCIAETEHYYSKVRQGWDARLQRFFLRDQAQIGVKA